MKLSGKVVLVTGGAHGIGRAMTLRFREEGVKGLVVADIDLTAAEEVAEAAGGFAIRCNVTKEEDIQNSVRSTEERFGSLDLLCSNAGVAFSDHPGWTATSQTNSQWQTAWEVNVMAHIWGTRAALPGMIRRGGGYLLHTVSAAGLLNQIGDAVYSTTKHAALGFAESVAITHGDQGITVSVLCPQAVETRMFTTAEHEAGAKAASVDGLLSPEEVAAAVVEGLETERFLILPHSTVTGYFQRKASDHDRWLGGMRRFRRSLIPNDDEMDFGAGGAG